MASRSFAAHVREIATLLPDQIARPLLGGMDWGQAHQGQPLPSAADCIQQGLAGNVDDAQIFRRAILATWANQERARVVARPSSGPDPKDLDGRRPHRDMGPIDR